MQGENSNSNYNTNTNSSSYQKMDETIDTIGPRSVQLKVSEPSLFWKQCRECVSRFYDLLTILISIADVTTDIIILISFYNKDRMVFFGISLAILILAQCAYAMAFSVRFDTPDKCGECLSILICCCIFPFGTLVAFCFYFTDNQESVISKWFRKINLDTNNRLTPASNHSKIRQFTTKKLSKHMGFVLEAAVEAFPQSLLQMTAIVLYQETNYVAIVSIFLSMLSVCTKSMIFSQGINFQVFIWSWICIITDFFGVFFAIAWIFWSPNPRADSNESPLVMHGRDFFSNFNLIAQPWIWKSLLTSVPIVACGLCFWFGYFKWKLLVKDIFRHNTSFGTIVFELFLLFIPFNIGVIISSFAGFIACEVFCCSILALVVFSMTTFRWRDWGTNPNDTILYQITNFVRNAQPSNNDRIVRILSVNYGLYKAFNVNDRPYPNASISWTLYNFIVQQQAIGGYEAIRNISYQDIRRHCKDRKFANVIPFIYEAWHTYLTKYYRRMNNDRRRGYPLLFGFTFVALLFGGCVFAPVVLICKLLQFLYPYFIVCVLSYFQLWTDIYIHHSFQFAMLIIYTALQWLMFAMFLGLLKEQYWLWHLMPGYARVVHFSDGDGQPQTANAVLKQIYGFYDDTIWLPQIEDYILDRFGTDVASLIIHYLKNMHVDTVSSTVKSLLL